MNGSGMPWGCKLHCICDALRTHPSWNSNTQRIMADDPWILEHVVCTVAEVLRTIIWIIQRFFLLYIVSALSHMHPDGSQIIRAPFLRRWGISTVVNAYEWLGMDLRKIHQFIFAYIASEVHLVAVDVFMDDPRYIPWPLVRDHQCHWSPIPQNTCWQFANSCAASRTPFVSYSIQNPRMIHLQFVNHFCSIYDPISAIFQTKNQLIISQQLKIIRCTIRDVIKIKSHQKAADESWLPFSPCMEHLRCNLIHIQAFIPQIIWDATPDTPADICVASHESPLFSS